MSIEELLDAIMEHVDREGELDPGHRIEASKLVTSFLALNQAAIVREAGDWFLNWLDRAGVKVEESNIRQGLAAIPTDQPALDRHDTEQRSLMFGEFWDETGLGDEPIGCETPAQLIAQFRKAVMREAAKHDKHIVEQAMDHLRITENCGCELCGIMAKRVREALTNEIQKFEDAFIRTEVYDYCQKLRRELRAATSPVSPENPRLGYSGICECGAPASSHHESNPSCIETGCKSYRERAASPVSQAGAPEQEVE